MKVLLSLGTILLLASCVTAEPENKRELKVNVRQNSRVWVAKQDGSKQCAQAKAAITPSTEAEALKNVGVLVFQGRSGNDGMMHTTVCGASTGNTVELEILKSDLPKLQARGYKVIEAESVN